MVSKIAANPMQREEAVALLPALDAALRPEGDRERMKNLLATKGIAFGLDSADHPPEWWAAKWSAYVDALEGFPLGIIERAFAIWNAPTDPANAIHKLDAGECKFYPRASQLHTIATRVRNELARTRWRAKCVADRENRVAPPKREHLSRAEMIAAGYMDEAGNIIGLGSGAKAIPTEYPRGPDHEYASRMRAVGVPINRSQLSGEEEAVG